MSENQPKAGPYLILQAKLAVDRTVMANDRTLLSFIRSALYFIVAGLTLNQLVSIRYGHTIATIAFIIGLGLLLIGITKYYRQLKSIRNGRQSIEQAANGLS